MVDDTAGQFEQRILVTDRRPGGSRGRLVCCNCDGGGRGGPREKQGPPGNRRFHDRSPIPNVTPPGSRGRTVRCSIRLSLLVQAMIRSTELPGVWTWSGLIAPTGKISSASHTVTLPAVAFLGFRVRGVLGKHKYTSLS